MKRKKDYRESLFYTRAPFWKPKKDSCVVKQFEEIPYFVCFEGGYPLLFDYREFVEGTLENIVELLSNQSSTNEIKKLTDEQEWKIKELTDQQQDWEEK